MISVSQTELAEQLEPIKNKQEIIDLAISIHKSMEKAVQRNFIDLLLTFQKVYMNRVNSQGGQSSHLQAGLRKLKDAETSVGELKKKAEYQRQLLA